MSARRTPERRHVEMAKLAVFWDDDADDELIQLFPYDNDPAGFEGDKQDLRAIRGAMTRYERQEAVLGEDEAYYRARYALQFVDTGDGDD